MRFFTWKYHAASVVSLLCAGALLGGCSSAGSSGAAARPVDLTSGPEVDPVFWHSMSGTNAAALQTMVDDFNTRHSSHIKVTTQYQGSYDDAVKKFKSAMLAKSGPDIMQCYDLGTRYMIDSGFNEPVQDHIDRSKWDLKQIDPNIAAYYTVKNRLYSMPFNSSTPLLYYNKDIFSQAGITSVPKTFEDIIALASKLTTAIPQRIAQSDIMEEK